MNAPWQQVRGRLVQADSDDLDNLLRENTQFVQELRRERVILLQTLDPEATREHAHLVAPGLPARLTVGDSERETLPNPQGHNRVREWSPHPQGHN